MNQPYDYEGDAEVRQLVVEWLNEDFADGVAQYSRMFASMVGLKVFEDWPPSERKALYATHPPIDLTGLPPADMPGVFPQWTAIAAEDQAYFVDRVKDWQALSKEALNGRG